MAGLTKEQRAQREAEKLAAQNGAEHAPAQQEQQPEQQGEQQQEQQPEQQQEQQQEQPGIELVVMVRDIPEFPNGPLSAEVHPAEVDNWLALDWRLEE